MPHRASGRDLGPLLLRQLAGLVAKPVIAHFYAADGPAVVLCGQLERVDTVGDVVHLCFDQEVHGTRIVAPARFLVAVGPQADDPLRLVLRYPGTAIALKDMSPRARIAHWRRTIEEALGIEDRSGYAGRMALLSRMIASERDSAGDETLAVELGLLLEEIESLRDPDAEFDQDADDDFLF